MDKSIWQVNRMHSGRQRITKLFAVAGLAAGLTVGLTFGLTVGLAQGATASDDSAADSAKIVAQGKDIAFDRVKGNCLACHLIADGDLTGNIAPPLVAMKQRFPDKSVLRAQIWDATEKNPTSVMPPYGRHNILSEDEIDQVVEYLYSL